MSYWEKPQGRPRTPLYLRWIGNDLVSPQISWRRWLGRSRSGLLVGWMDGWMAKVVLWVVKIDFNLFHLAGIEKVFSILIRTMGICKSSTWFSSDTEMVNIIIFLTVTNDWKMFAMTFRQALKRVAVVLLLENKSNHKRFTSKSKKKTQHWIIGNQYKESFLFIQLNWWNTFHQVYCGTDPLRIKFSSVSYFTKKQNHFHSNNTAKYEHRRWFWVWK